MAHDQRHDNHDQPCSGLTGGYLPFGASATITGSFRYTGGRIDPETAGLYYLRARMYSPAFGRFLQADPIGTQGGLNLYAYVGNDPLNAVHPSGLIMEGAGAGFSLTDANPDPIRPGQQYAQAPLVLCAGGPVGCGIGIGLTAGQLATGAFVGSAVAGGVVGGIILNNQDGSNQTSPAPNITPRPDLPPLSGGRSGQNVSGLTGPPYSAIPATGEGRIYVTDENGNVVADITRGRTKPVVPGQGFGPKREPTPGEIDLLDKLAR